MSPHSDPSNLNGSPREEEMSSLLVLHMLMNGAHAKRRVLSFRDSAFWFVFVKAAGYYHILKSKFTCPHTAVPSDTQGRVVSKR